LSDIQIFTFQSTEGSPDSFESFLLLHSDDRRFVHTLLSVVSFLNSLPRSSPNEQLLLVDTIGSATGDRLADASFHERGCNNHSIPTVSGRNPFRQFIFHLFVKVIQMLNIGYSVFEHFLSF
jgi:hypothetical protein